MRMNQVVASIVTLALSASIAFAGGDTAFTYQGRLLDAGEPANGLFDFEFSLWNAANGGDPIGVPQVLNNVPVSDGLFTVQVDFGAEAFDNAERWLEVTVNGIALIPRQPITRAPYSIQTRGIYVDASQNVGMGTTVPEAPLHVREGSAGTVTAQANSIAVFERAGQGFISILTPDAFERGILFGDPENLANGGIVFNNPSVPDGFEFRTGGNIPSMVIDATGNVGVGTSDPIYPLHVESAGNFITIQAVNTATSGFNNGVLGLSESTIGRGVFGWATATSGLNIGVFGQSDSTGGTGTVGFATAASGTTFGVWGQSNSSSGYDFYAAGAGQDYGSASSIRWKSNVRNIDQPLEKVARLRGVYFDWDEEHGGYHDVGMIAEDVGAVLPEIVNYEENGIDANGMDYSKLTPLLVEAVNALRSEKDTEIASLENEVAQMRERLAQLEALVARLAAQPGAER